MDRRPSHRADGQRSGLRASRACRKVSRFSRGGRTSSGLRIRYAPGCSRVILLDTNVFIRLMKGDSTVIEWLNRTPRYELGVSAIVVYELEYGSLKARFPVKRRDILQTGMA